MEYFFGISSENFLLKQPLHSLWFTKVEFKQVWEKER